jgi:hypothetical protein
MLFSVSFSVRIFFISADSTFPSPFSPSPPSGIINIQIRKSPLHQQIFCWNCRNWATGSFGAKEVAANWKHGEDLRLLYLEAENDAKGDGRKYLIS